MRILDKLFQTNGTVHAMSSCRTRCHHRHANSPQRLGRLLPCTTSFLLARQPVAKILRLDMPVQLFLSRLPPLLFGEHFFAHQPWEDKASMPITTC